MKPVDPKQAPSQDTAAAGPADDPADVDGRIERALAPYKGLVPAEDLAFMREQMQLYATTHPDVATLVDGLRKRPLLDGSTDMTRPGVNDASTELERPGGGPKQRPSPHRKATPGRR